MSGSAPGAGGRGSKPPKRSSTYESQSPPFVYSPSLTRSRPSSRCLRTTQSTLAPSSYGRLPTWVVRIFSVLRFTFWYGKASLGGGTMVRITIALAAALATFAAQAQQTIKIGMINVLSGQFADAGAQLDNGAKTYMKMHGDVVAGKKIE